MLSGSSVAHCLSNIVMSVVLMNFWKKTTFTHSLPQLSLSQGCNDQSFSLSTVCQSINNFVYKMSETSDKCHHKHHSDQFKLLVLSNYQSKPHNYPLYYHSREGTFLHLAF